MPSTFGPLRACSTIRSGTTVDPGGASTDARRATVSCQEFPEYSGRQGDRPLANGWRGRQVYYGARARVRVSQPKHHWENGLYLDT